MQFNHSSDPAHPSPFSMSDLSFQMSQYTLQQSEDYPTTSYTERGSYLTCSSDFPHQPPSPFPEPRSSTSTMSASSVPTSPSSYMTSASSISSSSSSQFGAGYHTTNVRQQRQRALRRQCSASHLREISALVARMVAESDQCSVSPPSPGPDAGERLRSNSESTASEAPYMDSEDYTIEDEVCEGTGEGSGPETFNDSCEGYSIQESGGCMDWHCPWTTRVRPADGKSCIKKDTSWRRRTRRRL